MSDETIKHILGFSACLGVLLIPVVFDEQLTQIANVLTWLQSWIFKGILLFLLGYVVWKWIRGKD